MVGLTGEVEAPVGRRRASMSRALYGDLIQLSDFVMVAAAAVVIAYIYHRYFLFIRFDLQRFLAAGLVGATGVTSLLRRDGYYDVEQLLSTVQSSRAVLARWSLVVLGLIAFGFALKMSEHFSRVWLFGWAGIVAFGLVVIRAIASAVLKRSARDGGVLSRRIAIVGATEVATHFAAEAASPARAISVVGLYALGALFETKVDNVAGDLAELERAARNGDIDDIVIAAPALSTEGMARLVNRLSTLPVTISICPNEHWLDHTGGQIVPIGGVQLLTLYRRPLEGWGGVLKTIEDYLIGVPAFLVALAPMALIALLIKIEGKGPVLFTQQRHGFNHKVFKIYKFRTMTVAEDGDLVVQAKQGDQRVTRVGKILRRYSLDELPQIFNVMRGEMSLVGPRPHALAHNHLYAQTIVNYSGRHKVKPGMTGWAQVNGYRGETSENELMAQRVKFDLEYIDNWSLWFDAKIILMTAAAVLFPKNAY
jgi:putative colanic acid biosynthesis UDP-glucose lipid carrier transferase